MEYIRVGDMDKKKVQELNAYSEFIGKMFANDKAKKIGDFKK